MIIKFAHVIILAAFKFILTLPYALIIGMEYKHALLAVLIGGIGGFIFFYYLSRYTIKGFYRVFPLACMWMPQAIKSRIKVFCSRKTPVKTRIFTRRSRIIARIRRSYGFWGIVVATPVLLTIPLGAFLASKYYPRQRFVVLYMTASIVLWTAVLSGIIHLFPKIFL